MDTIEDLKTFPFNLVKEDIDVHNSIPYIQLKILASRLGISTKIAAISNMTVNKHYILKKVNNKGKEVKFINLDGIKYIINNSRQLKYIKAEEFHEFFLNFIADNKEGINTQHIQIYAYIYLLHVKDNIYKYGITAHIDKRLVKHKADFNYQSEILIKSCLNESISRQVEKRFGDILRDDGIKTEFDGLVVKNKHREVFMTNNIDKYVNILVGILHEETVKYSEALPGLHKLHLEGFKELNKHTETLLMKTKEESQHFARVVADQTIKPFNDSMNRIQHDVGNLYKIIEGLVARIESLENSHNTTAPTIIETYRPINKPLLQLDIPMNLIIQFVSECIQPKVGNTLYIGVLYDEMKKLSYMSMFKDYERDNKRELLYRIKSTIKSIHNIDCSIYKENGISVEKDNWKNIDLIRVPIAEFVEARCVKHPDAKEKITVLNNEYISYCNSVERIPHTSTLANEFENNGFTAISCKSTHARSGLYVKNNSFNKFVHEKCALDIEYTTSWRVFTDTYREYCTKEKLYAYDEDTLKDIILPNANIEIHNNNGLVYIKSMKIKDLPIKIDEPKIKEPITMDVGVFISTYLIKVENGKVSKRCLTALIKKFIPRKLKSGEKTDLVNKVIVALGGKAGDDYVFGYTKIFDKVNEFIEVFVDKNKIGKTPTNRAHALYVDNFGHLDKKRFSTKLIKLGYKIDKDYKDNDYTRVYNFVLK